MFKGLEKLGNSKKITRSGQRVAKLGTPLREQVYEIIREELIHGEIEPGAKLVEHDLAARYGVSRTPVREALFQLAKDGLVESEGRSFILPIDTPKDIVDRIEVHLLIDPVIAKLAADRRTNEQVKALEAAFELEAAAAKASDLLEFIEGNRQFSKVLLLMADNAPLARCSDMIRERFLLRRRSLFEDEANRRLAISYDAKVLDAIKANDPEEAASQTSQYMTDVLQKYLSLMEAEAELEGA